MKLPWPLDAETIDLAMRQFEKIVCDPEATEDDRAEAAACYVKLQENEVRERELKRQLEELGIEVEES